MRAPDSAAREAAAPDAEAPPTTRADRVSWIDIAKGWCILLVVTMHSTLGVGVAVDGTGWLHALVSFAKPFRMPDFFIISGLFASPALSLPWLLYFDKRVVHFVYFYSLWLAIILACKSLELGIASPLRFTTTYLHALIEPFSSLWFIHLLPIFFVVYRLSSRSRVVLVIGFAGAALLHVLAAAHPVGGSYAMSANWTGWSVVDNFSLFFFFFLVGAAGRNLVLRFAEMAAMRPWWIVIGLGVWIPAQAFAVRSGLPELPGFTLLFALMGSAAVIGGAVLLAQIRAFQWVGYLGRHSLPIYLAFALPMAATRLLLLRAWPWGDIGIISTLVTTSAVTAPLILERYVRGTALRFLFVRPTWARIDRLRPRQRKLLSEIPRPASRDEATSAPRSRS